MNKESYQIAHYINDFLNVYVPQSKTKSIHTQKSYKDSMNLYLDFLELKKNVTVHNITYNHFNGEMVEEWLVWLMAERNNQPQTANVRLASIRAFIHYLYKKDKTLGYLEVDAEDIELRKAPKIKVKGMSREAVKAIANAISQTTLVGIRDFLVFVVLYDTAIRIDELLSLKIKDLDLNRRKPCIHVVGKGNKARSLGLKPKTVKALKRYIKMIEWTSEDNYIFHSRIKGLDVKMTDAGVDKQLKKWAKIAHEKCREVPLKLHAHQIRHAAATHWLEDGMNIGEIQYLLGHEDIKTTMVYLEITVAQKSAAITKTIIEEKDNQPKNWLDNIDKLRDLCK